MQLNKKNSGLTLIETLVYTALLGIIMSGALVASYEIIRGDENLSSKVETIEAANFILRKIDWALVGSSKSSVEISLDGDTLKTALAFFRYRLSTQILSLGSTPLNTEYTLIENLSFSYLPGIIGVEIAFDLNDQSFTKTHYFSL